MRLNQFDWVPGLLRKLERIMLRVTSTVWDCGVVPFSLCPDDRVRVCRACERVC